MNLAEFFNNINRLPVMPHVVQELLAMIDAPEVNSDHIVAKLTQDPVLTATVLRLANSAHYSGARSVSSISDAVVTMGVKSLKSLILASGVESAFNYPVTFDRKIFWDNTMALAFTAKDLAVYSNEADIEETYTVGVLHNIGEILIAIEKPAAYNQISANALKTNKRRHVLEKATLGVTSAEISAGLAKKWKFPENIRLGLIEQNNAEPTSPYAAIVGICKFIFHLREKNYDAETIKDNIPANFLTVAALEPSNIMSIIEKLDSINNEAIN